MGCFIVIAQDEEFVYSCPSLFHSFDVLLSRNCISDVLSRIAVSFLKLSRIVQEAKQISSVC